MYKVTWILVSDEPETIDADSYADEPPWITFVKAEGDGTSRNPNRKRQVLRVRADLVARIDWIGDTERSGRVR